MMRDLKQLQAYWRANSSAGLMLCTLIGKQGSGYRTVGAQKIIRRDGDACGFLSGGCLGGEIVRHARANWEQVPFRKSFSTMSEEDRLLGYQTGCAGVIDILFERLPGDLSRMGEYLPYGPSPDRVGTAVSLAPESLGRRLPLAELPAASTHDVFIARWVAPWRLFVIGGGPAARPLAELAAVLGWDVILLDYRQSHQIDDLPGVTSIIVPLDVIPDRIETGPLSAVVLMTHNYEADLTLVNRLNGRAFGYFGCVGPRRRFERMSDDLPRFHGVALDPVWAAQVHAPAGAEVAHAPELIALAIVAEIQAVLGGAA